MYESKKELFDYLNNIIDKSGNLKKESGFRVHFPDMYRRYLEFNFPDEISNLPFRQKLYHFLTDVLTIPVCKICGGEVGFSTRRCQWGYKRYCSGK